MGRQHRLLARELRAAIDVGRRGRILFHVGRALAAVEHEVGGNMQERNAGMGRRRGQSCGAIAVER
jgi:hypothetical protein